jgi:hypothetical protein
MRLYCCFIDIDLALTGAHRFQTDRLMISYSAALPEPRYRDFWAYARLKSLKRGAGRAGMGTRTERGAGRAGRMKKATGCARTDTKIPSP